MRFNYQMHFSKTGRARFIAHLDTLSCLMRALRRTGYELAFTEGMRPKPILSLAMPLGVGIEGEDEICEFSLKQRAPLPELAKKISRQLPEGIELKSVGPTYDRSKAASRVGSVTYRIELDNPPAQLEKTIRDFNALESIVITRRRPKGDKEIDIKKYVPHVELSKGAGGIEFEMQVTPEGTGRPEEVVEAFTAIAELELPIRRMTRTGIAIREAEPAVRAPRGGPAHHRRRR